MWGGLFNMQTDLFLILNLLFAAGAFFLLLYSRR
jgi:hypothetical protein